MGGHHHRHAISRSAWATPKHTQPMSAAIARHAPPHPGRGGLRMPRAPRNAAPGAGATSPGGVAHAWRRRASRARAPAHLRLLMSRPPATLFPHMRHLRALRERWAFDRLAHNRVPSAHLLDSSDQPRRCRDAHARPPAALGAPSPVVGAHALVAVLRRASSWQVGGRLRARGGTGLAHDQCATGAAATTRSAFKLRPGVCPGAQCARRAKPSPN